MKTLLSVLALVASTFQLNAGTLSYQALPASDTDTKSGISSDSGYTSAVDGGNATGTDRVVNGITLYSLKAENDSSTADSCTLNALSGSLSNAGGSSGSVAADGTMKDVLSDMTSNDGAGDNSQQEIVLDPASLESGATYDLRVYFCNSGGQNRQVSLSFVGDGQAAVETGFFNEDDATTSGGGFKDPNQVYYISYRFTWDGDSTPGITITQKSGNAPFALYALTNQLVPGDQAAAPNAGDAGNAAAAAGGGAASGGDNTAAAGGDNAGGDEGLSEGQVDQGDDQVGVQSDDFYNSESLNSNGQWVDVEKWGKCWQPTNVSQGWCPYTNGGFQNCDTCGWTFVSDEPWAWACYHYGRWCKVSYGCGWCWVPGRVWAGSWVSWRRGQGEKCSCVGWAPLPPECGCSWNVGVSSWVDSSCNIGPECYTFIDVANFGRESYFGCGCMYERSRNCAVILETFNCTNICHGFGGTYCGGPDFHWCNERIREHGGMECKQVHVNRFNDPSRMGGKFSNHDGHTLGLMSPKINGGGKFSGKTAASLKGNQIEHGWNGIKDPKAKTAAENHIKAESKGKDPKNTKATLPADVAKQREAKQHGHGGMAGAGNQAGGKGSKLHPGNGKTATGGQTQTQSGVSKVIRDQSSQNGQTGKTGQTKSGKSDFNQHPGGKNKGTTAGVGANTAGKSTGNQHPSKGNNKTVGTGKTGASNAGTGTGKSGAGGMHPGQSLKGKTNQNTAGKNEGNNQGGGRIGTAWNNGKESGGNKTTAGAGTGGTGQGTKGSTNAGHKNEGSNATGTGGSSNKTGGTGKQAGTSSPASASSGTGSKGKGPAKSSTQGATGTGQHTTSGQSGKSRSKLQAHGQSSGQTSGTGGSVSSTSKGAQSKTHTQTQSHTSQNQTHQRSNLQSHPVQHQQQQVHQQQHQQQHQQPQRGGGASAQPKPKPKPKPKPTPNRGAAAASDRRVKTNIVFVGRSPMGIPIYQFSYINQPNKRYQGTIAQDVARIRPDAIIWRDGIMWVDYSRLDVRMEELPPIPAEKDDHIGPP